MPNASSLHKSRIRRYLSTLESRSDGILGGSTIVARSDFPSVSGDNIDEVVSTLVCLEIQPGHNLYRFFASQSLRTHCHLRQEGFCRWAPCHLSTEERLLSSDTDDLPSRVLPHGTDTTCS